MGIESPRSRRSRAKAFIAFVLLASSVYWLTSSHHNHTRRLIKELRPKLTSALGGSRHEKPPSKVHPISLLHQEATERFERLISRQSTTYDEAVAEYTRRYQRDPPPGFEDWFDFAQGKNSVIIDDYDMILESLEPWQNIKPAVMNDIFLSASEGPDLWYFGVTKGVVITDAENWMGVYMRELLKDVSQYLPDFRLLGNPLDEPRVLLSRRGDTEIIHWMDESKVSSWDRVEAPCKYGRSSLAPKEPESAVNTNNIPFVTNRYDSMDICVNPDFESQHGFLIAPYSMLTTSSPVPVLSQAKPSTFADILYPSMWYFDVHMDDLFLHDPVWDNKEDVLYWAGSTTGGAMRETAPGDGERLSHRHRFIKATKQLGEHTYKFLTRQPKTGYWVPHESSDIMSQLYDTKFTAIVQCEGKHCDSANETYHVGEREDQLVAYQHKFLMDLDGNSFSGRFYNFLQSRSCPLKQTIFREWHDERLMPWVHYVPISVGLEDLPETMRFLATDQEGQLIAESIAKSGKEWHDRFLRRDDAAVYLFRLFLEYARLVDPERKM